MGYRYVQVDENGLVKSDSILSNKIDNENSILIDMELDITDKKYVDGTWIDYIPDEGNNMETGGTENLEPPITDNDIMMAEVLLNQCNMLINQENQDAVLAEILLNQMGV